MAGLPAPVEGIALSHFIVARDVDRSRRFYADVLGGETVLARSDFAIVALANVSAFLNIRVADIGAVYEQWRRLGARFMTPPIDHGVEIRCYMRDPDGHLIEVGQLVRREDL
jgi:catechol 2,3-dioxygenase-like lactoylglutathione lyase family enzyme